MRDLDAQAAGLAPHLQVLKPDGPGPFPVVIQMHGCGGITGLQQRYARVARAGGFAVVIADSLAPRGIGRTMAQLTVCTGLRFRGDERAADFLALVQWLRSQSWADSDCVVGAGWSHGAWAIMEAMVGDAPPALLAPVRSVVLFYPYAGVTARTHARGWGSRRPEVRALLCGRDAVVGHKPAQRALDRLGADGLDVRVTLLPEGTHCFDDDEAGDPRTRYSPVLTAQAESFYATALAEVRA